MADEKNSVDLNQKSPRIARDKQIDATKKTSSDTFELTDNFCKKSLSSRDLQKQ